jgi:hypothetical protein
MYVYLWLNLELGIMLVLALVQVGLELFQESVVHSLQILKTLLQHVNSSRSYTGYRYAPIQP